MGSPPARSERRTVRRRSGRPRACVTAPVPPGAAQRAGEAQVGHESPGLRVLGRRVGREVAVAQHLGRAAPDAEHRGLVRLGVVRLVPGGIVTRVVEGEHDLGDRRDVAVDGDGVVRSQKALKAAS